MSDSAYSGWFIIWILLFAGIGYLIDGGIGAAVGAVVVILAAVLLIVGLIPFGGPIIYWYVAFYDVGPFLLHYGHGLGLLVTAALLIGLAISIVVCCITSVITLGILADV